MVATCPTCNARYKVADEKVSPGGTKFKCKKCGGTFTAYRETAPQSKPPAAQRPKSKSCPHCGKPIPLEAVKCRHCRQPVGEQASGFEPGESYAQEESYAREGEAFRGGAPGYAGGGYEGGGGAPGYRTHQASAPAPASVPNYLVWSILATLFCCLPFGIVAIVYAAQVNGKLAGGDVEGAMESSGKAKMWCWVSFGLGLAGALLYGVLLALGIVAE